VVIERAGRALGGRIRIDNTENDGLGMECLDDAFEGMVLNDDG
jgi:hypothetical protein